MRTSAYYIKGNDIHPVISGKYGNYSKQNGANYSDKQMLNRGYTIQQLTKTQADNILLEKYQQLKAQEEKEYIHKMQSRFDQVEKTLSLAPKPIECLSTSTCFTAKIGDNEGYEGCGRGTAYIVDNNIIAWHYGYEKPSNAPNCYHTYIDISCYEICI